jgi:DNA helicase-2/ATP-dependent DNA helicase PcrA
LFQALQNVAACDSLTAKALAGLDELGSALASLRSIVATTSVAGLIDSLLRRIDYLHHLDDGSPLGEARQENVRELLSVAQEYRDIGLEGFLEEVALVSDVDTADFGSDAVMLMTIHAAKGLEFPVVFMGGMEETVFPHSRAMYDQAEMEEERRLCYVGMTRAKQELYMAYSTGRLLYGGMQHNLPSRFLGDITSGFQFSSGSSTHDWLNPFRSGSPGEEYKSDLQEPRYVLEVNEGDGIRHQLFGVGTVVAVNGDIVTVHFAGKGTKILNLSFAPLEKL